MDVKMLIDYRSLNSDYLLISNRSNLKEGLRIFCTVNTFISPSICNSTLTVHSSVCFRPDFFY